MTQTYIFHKCSSKLGVIPRKNVKKVAFCATFSAETQVFALFYIEEGKVLFVILSDGEAGVEGSVNILKRESGFFDFATYGRFAQNDT